MNEPSFFGWVHAWIVKLGLDSDALIANSVVEMYSKNGLVDEGMKVSFCFCFPNGNTCSESLNPNVMVALVQGCTLSGYLERGKVIHGFLIKLGCPPTPLSKTPSWICMQSICRLSQHI